MDDNSSLVEMTTRIVTAQASAGSAKSDEIPALIASVYASLAGLGQSAPEPVAEESKRVTPAAARKSITNEKLISFIDGKGYSTLKRHLTGAGHTADSYRETFGLPMDYPMTAPAYTEKRRALAKSIGLGRKPGTKVTPKAAAAPAKVPAKRGRKPKVAAS